MNRCVEADIVADIASFLLALLVASVLIFLAPLLGCLLGAFSGAVVGLFFGDAIIGIIGQLGVKDVSMWQVGLFLGFLSGFFRPVVKSKG